MGKKDTQLKWYLGKDRIFADFCNGALYGGKKVVLPENLGEVQRFYQEELSDREGNRGRRLRERDVAKLLCHNGGAATGLRELMDLSGMDAALEYGLADYRLRVFNLAQLQEENFETGLRELIGMFKRRDSKEEMRRYYMENRKRFSQLDEDTYDVICTMLQLKSLEGKKECGRRQGKEGIDMCKAFDDWAKEEQEKGREEGRKEGRKEGERIGEERGERRGEKRGELRMGQLVQRLIGDGRMEDLRGALTDLQIRRQLYREYGME